MVQILPIASIAEQRFRTKGDQRFRSLLRKIAILSGILFAFVGTVMYYGQESFEIRKYMKYIHDQEYNISSSVALQRMVDVDDADISFDDYIEGDDEIEDGLEEEINNDGEEAATKDDNNVDTDDDDKHGNVHDYEKEGEEEEEENVGEEEEEEEGLEDQNQVNEGDTTTEARTSYKIIQNLGYENTFDVFYNCNEVERNNSSPLFAQDTILDFHAQMSTSLKVLIMGDSVGIQYSQSLQEAAGASYDHRKVLRYSWGLHEGIHLASPVRGGGAIAGWRITGMFRQEEMNNNLKMPNNPGGGWMEYDVRKIRRALAAMSPKRETEDSSSFCDIQEPTPIRRRAPVEPAVEEDPDAGCAEENFDVVVHQFPFGWMKRRPNGWFTHERIDEAVQLSRTQFGAKVVILQTIPVQNNLVDMVSQLKVINDAIFDYSNTYESNLIEEKDDGNLGKESNERVETVLVMDLAKFSYELFAQNAASLNMIKTDAEAIQAAFVDNSITQMLNPLLSQRTKCCNLEFPQIIGFTCSEVSSQDPDPEDCIKTRYSRDGMHWCMDEVGGRINGGLACLLKCVEPGSKSADIRSCEKLCNDQFMSLSPMRFDASKFE